MRFVSALIAGCAVGLALTTSACAPRFVTYTGPGCLLYIFPRPALQGTPLPVMGDTEDLASAWQETSASAKVVYGTWRLYADSGFSGFMGDYRAPAEIPSLTPMKKIGSLLCVAPEAPPPSPY